MAALTAHVYVSNVDEPQARQLNDPLGGNAMILIPQSFAYSWDVILHEYGHWVRSADGNVLPGIKEGETHELTANLTIKFPAKGLNLAFDEGFASYFAVAAAATVTGPQASIPYVGARISPVSILSRRRHDDPIQSIQPRRQWGAAGQRLRRSRRRPTRIISGKEKGTGKKKGHH